MQLDLGAEPALHAVDDHLDVDLGEPGDDLLARLGVAVDVERRILLLQAPDRRGGLLLVALGLGLVGERHHRRGQVERREPELGALQLGQDVARSGLPQLRDGADVARSQRVDGLVLLALGHGELADPLLLRARGVHDLGVRAQDARVDAQQVDPARVGVGGGLEDVGDQLAVGIGLDLDLLAASASSAVTAPRIAGEGRSSMIASSMRLVPRFFVAMPQVTGNRWPSVTPFFSVVHQLVVGDLLALQVALHQLVGVLGDLVHQLLAVLLRLLGELLGDLLLGRVRRGPRPRRRRPSCRSGRSPPSLVLGADRDLGRDDVRAERLLQRIQRAEEVGPLAVEHVHVDQPRQALLGRRAARGGRCGPPRPSPR